MVQLNQKETMLLKDLKSHEELCVKKYGKAANETQDQVLKQLFTQLGQTEQQHLNTVNQIIGGQIPNMGTQSGSQKMTDLKSNTASQADFDLCKDLLNTEKYVSATYNTAIFEFTNPQIRSILNHIQKEEQEHGEQIYYYLQQNGGYQQ
ncbi:MAG: spore coat protein [Bacilli bacterium]|nr:spore coat protein [Bacilli bacterium]MDD4077820.1 spore coat protein [Bacilli bacterium]